MESTASAPYDWQRLAEFLKTEIGYILRPEKFYLMDTHVRPFLQELGISDIGTLIDRCRIDTSTRQGLINRCTINESHFFRDPNIWQAIADRMLGELIPEVGFWKKIRILCCACSTGQEVYTLAMMLNEQRQQLGEVTYQILATDIDTDVLKSAKEGRYNRFDVSRGLDQRLRDRYMIEDGDSYRVREELKRDIIFQQVNLAQPFTFPQRFDIIFCRNVLIYFDNTGKKLILDRLANMINGYGFLVLGGSETAWNISDAWKPRKLGPSTFYQKAY